MKARLLILITTAALAGLSAAWILPEEGRGLQLPAPIHTLYHGYRAGQESGSWIFSFAEALGHYAVHGEPPGLPPQCYAHEGNAGGSRSSEAAIPKAD